MTIHRKCDDCGKDYEAAGDWQKICKHCFHLAKVKEGQQAKEAKESPASPGDPTTAAALNRVADAIRKLAQAVESRS